MSEAVACGVDEPVPGGVLESFDQASDDPVVVGERRLRCVDERGTGWSLAVDIPEFDLGHEVSGRVAP